MGFIFGPIIGGFLSEFDPSLKLTITTGSVIFSTNVFFVLVLLPASKKDLEIKAAEVSRSKTAAARGSWNFRKYFHLDSNLFHRSFKGFHFKEISDVLTVQFLASFSVIIFRFNFPVFLEENFILSSTTFGLIIGFTGITSSLASASCGIIFKYYANHSKHLLHFMILLFVSLFSITVLSDVFYIFFFLITLSLSSSNLRICMLSLILMRGREDEKGAIVGFSGSLSSFSRMIGPIVVGVTQEFGSRSAGIVSVLLALSALLGTICFSIGDVRRKYEGKERNQNY